MVFKDPATGEPRLVSAATGRPSLEPGDGRRGARAEPEGHSEDESALVTFVEPATGELRVATGSWMDKTIRVWDAETPACAARD